MGATVTSEVGSRPQGHGALLDAAAQAYGEAVAYQVDGQSLRFCDLADTTGIAAALAEQGVGAGSRVALWSSSCVEMILLMHAIARTGAATVPLNTRLRADDATAALALARPDLIVVNEDDATTFPVGPQQSTCPLLSLRAFVGRVRQASSAGLPWTDLEPPGGVTQLQFTSGATNQPKLVRLTETMVVGGAQTLCDTLGLAPQDRLFSPLPLFHAGGSVLVLMAPVLSGCRADIQRRFDADAALRWMHENQVTVTFGHQPHYTDYLASGTAAPPTLRAALIFANPDFNDKVQDYLGDAILFSPYGLTETALAVTSPRLTDPREVRVNTVGRPVPGVDVRLDPVTSEILVRGWSVSPGYEGSAMPAMSDADGWYHTGDIGRLVDGGNLVLVGRLKEMIRVGGENFLPAEVENRLLTHPAVKQAVVMGVPDPRLGEVCAAVVELVPGSSVSVEELAEHCARTLASFKVPREIVVVSDWPRSASGKIAKPALRSLFMASE